MLKTRTRAKTKARLKAETRTRIGTRMTFSKLRVVIPLSWFRERAISGCNKNLAGPVLHGLELALIEAPGAPEVETQTNTPFTRAPFLSICPFNGRFSITQARATAQCAYPG